jgi:Fe-S cluster biogenesis protein NfuA
MTNTLDARDFQARLERLDHFLQEAERAADPAARTRLQGIVQALLELHGVGLERLLDLIADRGEAGQAILDACACDDVVSGLLLLHGLHPLDLESRVRQALDGVRPYLRSHGGSVELLDVDGEVVRLRLLGSCDGCPSSAATIKHTIEQAILGKAPEIRAVEVEGLPEHAPADDNHSARVALPVV